MNYELKNLIPRKKHGVQIPFKSDNRMSSFVKIIITRRVSPASGLLFDWPTHIAAARNVATDSDPAQKRASLSALRSNSSISCGSLSP
jgi:hypothetical protein